jgi:hypothetical protein
LKGREIMLRILRIWLPGNWADGWLYKEQLILWSMAGEMFVLPVAELTQLVRQRASARYSVAADYAIFRNDWKGSEQFKRLLTMTDFTEALYGEFGDTNESATMILDSYNPVPVPSDSVPGRLLDASVYANRIYMASTDGLFETRFNPDKPQYSHPVVRRLDHQVSAINAKYSVIIASADDRGLLFAPVNFDDTNWWRQDQAFVTIAERSCRNSFASFNVLNYSDDSFPTLLLRLAGAGRRGGGVGGGGKSAIYELAEMLKDGPTVVVSPLIALQDDQLAHLDAAGLPAVVLNAQQPARSHSAPSGPVLAPAPAPA